MQASSSQSGLLYLCICICVFVLMYLYSTSVPAQAVAGQTLKLSVWSAPTTMDPPQTTLCHRPSLLIVHPGVRIIGQHTALLSCPKTRVARIIGGAPSCISQSAAGGPFVRELILDRSFDVSMLQSCNYFSPNLIYINRLR